MKIFMIGYRCTGKTTLGKLLAHHLGFDFMDIDQMIEHHTQSTISQIVETFGWEKFRQIEKQMLLTTQTNKNTVIATGGGILLDGENQQFIKQNGICIWLDADVQTIFHRLKNDIKTLESRPPLTENDLLKETAGITLQRKPLYEKTAQIRIDTCFHSPEEIIHIIDRKLKNVRL